MGQPSQRDPVVDVHAHAMPMPLLCWLADLGLADVSGAAEEVIRLDSRVSGVGDRVPLPLARSQHDVGVRLAEMDDVGVSHHAVSMPPFLFCSTADDGGLVRDVVARGNTELAAYVAGGQGRLVALGSVPLGWPGAAAQARRCLDELGMAGIAIGSRGAGRDLDDPVNEELWELLAERRAFVFLHPSGVPDAHRQRDFYLAQLVGYPMETALAVARLVFGGVLERFDLTLCLAHGGGCLPAIRGRMDMGWRNKDVARTTTKPPSFIPDAFTTTPRCSPRSCCGGWSKTSARATSCSAPIIRSSCATPSRWPASRPRNCPRRRPARSCGTTAAGLLGLA